MNKPCFWCNTKPSDVEPDLSPHATWCPYYRPYCFSVDLEGLGKMKVEVDPDMAEGEWRMVKR